MKSITINAIELATKLATEKANQDWVKTDDNTLKIYIEEYLKLIELYTTTKLINH